MSSRFKLALYRSGRRAKTTEPCTTLNATGEAMAENLQDYLTVGGAATFLGVSAKTLREWDRAGKLKPIRHPINQYRLCARTDLEAFLQGLADARAAVRG